MSKILVVDDERLVLQQVSKYLESCDYEYDFISKPKFLYNKLESENFELILLDINMEGQDGMSILRDLKKSEKYKHHAVIMLTGEVGEKNISDCFELGASDYITKPIRELEFKARVKAVMELNQYIRTVEKQAEELRHNRETIMKSISKINASIDVAKRIQNAMLPSLKDLRNMLPKSFIFFKPKDIVSGDFYWCDRVIDPSEGQELIIIAAGDCTGHGVSGAFMTALGTTLLKEIISHNQILEPNKILQELNKRLIAIITSEDKEAIKEGMEICVSVIDKRKQLLHFSGAKRPIINISKNGDMSVNRGSIFSIGSQHIKTNDIKFDKYVIELEKGSTYYMFSDGFQDQFNEENAKKYSRKKLLDFFKENYSKSFDEQKELLEQELNSWKGQAIQTDDILIMGFQV